MNYEPINESLTGNGRGVQDENSRSAFTDYEMAKDTLHEPEYEMNGIEGNGFAPQDPRSDEHQEHMTERTKDIFNEGKTDFENPLTEEEQGDEFNPYQKGK